jgi:hypothetical protein
MQQYLLFQHIMGSQSHWPRGLRHKLVFACSNTVVVGSNLTQGMDVCVCIYSVFVLSCVGSGLATA